MPAVAVILCARDAAATIDTAVESVRAQSFQDWELILINDGSTDATGERMLAHAAADSRIQVLQQCEKGIVSAFEYGRAHTAAPLIARMDADDAMLPARLERQVEYLNQHPETGLVSCKVDYGGDRRRQRGYARYVDWVNSLQTPEQIALRRFIESPIVNPAV
ncbi:MAG: glycosyltransferase family 2 protein, partial [Opitutales bacterium]|nr:glycosyltransferase family 2 protein [Opitutales bacterium]